MKIIVTGGAGFIGSHIVDRLIDLGHKVFVIDNLSSGQKDNLNSRAVFFKFDIRDKKVSEIVKKEKPEYLFHLAAQKDVRKSVEDPGFDADVNITGTLNLLEACQKIGAKIIFSSTGGAIYGDTDFRPTPETHQEKPVSPYGVSKLAVDKYLHYYDKVSSLKYVSLRLANIYGPRQDPRGEAGVVAIFINKLLKKEQPVINGDGRQTRDYVYVLDVVEAAIAAMADKSHGLYNIGTGLETSVNELFKKIINLGGFKAEEKHGPALMGEQMTSALDYQKAKKELSWQPKYNLDQGLKDTITWFREKNGKKPV